MLKGNIGNFVAFFIFALIIYSIISPYDKRNNLNLSEKVYAVYVYDGDTIKIDINGRKDIIRLLGIDCPEKEQQYGKKAKEFTMHFLGLDHNRKVAITLEFEEDNMRDKYGRLLAYVYNSHGEMLNKALLKNGLALPFFLEKGDKYTKIFKKLAREAKNNKINIWDSKNPLKETPYDFRHSQNP